MEDHLTRQICHDRSREVGTGAAQNSKFGQVCSFSSCSDDSIYQLGKICCGRIHGYPLMPKFGDDYQWGGQRSCKVQNLVKTTVFTPPPIKGYSAIWHGTVNTSSLLHAKFGHDWQ